jgi:hypothetical protein
MGYYFEQIGDLPHVGVFKKEIIQDEQVRFIGLFHKVIVLVESSCHIEFSTEIGMTDVSHFVATPTSSASERLT